VILRGKTGQATLPEGLGDGIAGGCTSRKRGRPVGMESVRESVPARFAQAGFVERA
jgi:hypothetical protein